MAKPKKDVIEDIDEQLDAVPAKTFSDAENPPQVDKKPKFPSDELMAAMIAVSNMPYNHSPEIGLGHIEYVLGAVKTVKGVISGGAKITKGQIIAFKQAFAAMDESAIRSALSVFAAIPDPPGPVDPALPVQSDWRLTRGLGESTTITAAHRAAIRAFVRGQ